ncbi:MAG: hypothetical protein WCG93_09735 [Paludibacter sp.]
MKKIIVLVMVAFAANVFAANPSEYSVFSKLNNKATFKSLVIYLNADQEQVDFLEHVLKVTEEEMKSAGDNENMAENVLNYNLRNSKCILSEEQYKKYLVFVNLSFNNKSTDFLLSNVLISANNK